MNSITLVGNLGGDPVLRFGTGGKARATFSVAVSEQFGEGEERTHWVNVTAFGTLAENVAESLSKGTRVVVVGRLDTYKQELFDSEGKAVNMTKVSFTAQEVSPSLRFALAKVTKVQRDASDQQPAAATNGSQSRRPAPAAAAAPAQARTQAKPAAAAPAAAAPDAFDEEPF